jgi:membrane protease YdiL (CAAX protease family)
VLLALLQFFVFGTLLVYLITAVCRERLSSLNLRPGKWYWDLLHGLLLCLAAMLVAGLTAAASAGLGLGRNTDAMAGMSESAQRSPLLLFALLVIYPWISAVLEEFTRSVFLSRLFALYPQRAALLAAVAAAALLCGMYHLYHGLTGAITLVFFGLVMALYYYWFKRVLPMILAHGIFGMFAVAMTLAQPR